MRLQNRCTIDVPCAFQKTTVEDGGRASGGFMKFWASFEKLILLRHVGSQWLRPSADMHLYSLHLWRSLLAQFQLYHSIHEAERPVQRGKPQFSSRAGARPVKMGGLKSTPPHPPSPPPPHPPPCASPCLHLFFSNFSILSYFSPLLDFHTFLSRTCSGSRRTGRSHEGLQCSMPLPVLKVSF